MMYQYIHIRLMMRLMIRAKLTNLKNTLGTPVHIHSFADKNFLFDGIRLLRTVLTIFLIKCTA